MTIIRRTDLIPARPGTNEQFVANAAHQLPGTIQAKINSRCPDCRKPIKKWQWIRKNPLDRWVHVDCSLVNDDAATRLQARRARLRAEKAQTPVVDEVGTVTENDIAYLMARKKAGT